MKAVTLYSATLESLIFGLLAAIYMAWAALNHNPQDEFYDTGHRVVVAENLLPMMATWFAAIAILWLILRLSIGWYVLVRMRTPH